MSVRDLEQALGRELAVLERTGIFQRTKRRHRVFASYTTLADVLGALRRFSSTPVARRDALVEALIIEGQRRPHRILSAAITLAFAPLIERLCRSLGRTWGDDSATCIVAALLETVATLPVPGRFTLSRVRRELERRVYGLAADERAHRARMALFLEDAPASSAHLETYDAYATLTARAACVELDASCTLVGIGLRTFVLAAYPTASAHEHARAYERLKRRRSRALVKLRRLVGCRTGRAVSREAGT